MTLRTDNIFKVLIVIVFTLNARENISGYIGHINSLSKHANELVRMNEFDKALYFYTSIFNYIDSVKNTDQIETELDSIEIIMNNHYSNLSELIKEINYFYDPDSKVFHLDKSDLDLIEKEDILYDPFPHKELKMVKKYLEKYNGIYRRTMQTYIDRSGTYISEVKKVFDHFGLPEELAYVPMAESGYVPFAHSYAKAAGLWQFIPSTARFFGLNINWWEDERKDVIRSTIAAAKFYKLLYKKFGKWNLVLAAYNCGEGGVRRRIRKHKTDNFWRLYSLPKQTKDYVPKVRALIKIAQDPEKYGFRPYDDQITMLDTVQLDSCINLNAIADICEITYNEIKKLNPQLRQWCLPPYAKNYAVVIPADSKVYFRDKFNKYPADKLFSIKEQVVKKGDSIKKIADEYSINIQGIKDMNGINDHYVLKEGDVIKIPLPPVGQKWFRDFNKKYLTYYDDEKYYLDSLDKLHYRVKRGDSVWSIARKFKISRKKLKAWNKIGKNNLIKPGQRIVIYL